MRSIRNLFWIFLCIAMAACTVGGPVGITTAPDDLATATPTLAPTSTNTPSPTATPTPLPEARIAMGDDALFVGDYDRAIDEYQEVLNRNPEGDVKASALLGVGRIYTIRGDYAAALDPLRFVIEQYPGTDLAAAAYFQTATIYDALDRFTEAADAYAKYIELKPGVIDDYIQTLRGDALTNAADYDGAAAAYQSAQAAFSASGATDLDFKLAQNLVNQGDFQGAVERYQQIYAAAGSDVTKARADYELGQVYLTLGLSEDAIASFQDAITNFPRAYSSYLSLVELVEAGVEVNELTRGLVDYFAGQYGPAINAIDRYTGSGVQLDGSPFYYKGLALRTSDSPEEAITQWEVLINNFPQDRYWANAWDEKAYTQWAYLGDYTAAAETMKDFVAAAPDDPLAPEMLFQAGRNYERAGLLSDAAATWDQMANAYSSSEYGFQGLFLSGITYYRMQDLPNALTAFQRALTLAVETSEQAAAYLWIGKVQLANQNTSEAQSSLKIAAELDPTGYYSERAQDLLTNRQPFAAPESYDFSINLDGERAEAESWLRTTFNLPADTQLSGMGALTSNARLARGLEFWRLGLYEEGRNELESLRSAVEDDPVASYQLINVLYNLGIYRSAILASRQVLSLAAMDDAAALRAPAFFNHIRFGPYFKERIIQAAKEEDVSPLLLMSAIRQESLFEGFAISSAGARGLMQIMPDTGASIATNLGWPAGYTDADLYRTSVSIRLGSHYLAQQLELFDGDVFAALAAYNSGPGNSLAWQELAPDDPDLFVETVRIEETRTYIKQIYENFNIYRQLYTR
ncbi:MAG TPA: tetratricopeptide repeat protein [Anaerolineaceae bacterium]|nr:tetratricopeptide repeat protein [Anaerolineaceae bacterium]